MSRTKKDMPSKVKFPEFFNNDGYYSFQVSAKRGDIPKKPKHVDTEWHWLDSTPSWWTNMFMNRPLRRQAQKWEQEVKKIQDLDELEDVDKPNVSKKPHKYYW